MRTRMEQTRVRECTVSPRHPSPDPAGRLRGVLCFMRHLACRSKAEVSVPCSVLVLNCKGMCVSLIGE